MNRLVWFLAGFVVACSGSPALAQRVSVGQFGIEAYKLQESPYNLLGRKIAIGQVEIGRPGQFGFDKTASKNRALEVTGVFFRNVPAKSDRHVDIHAQNVASVMVDRDKALRGVAPGARLYASAIGLMKRNSQAEECLSVQHVAQQNSGDVRAINLSFGESLQHDLRSEAVLDGNALLTRCIDWSARVHNVLYVIAGNQGKGGIPIPTDSYNGITVAFTTLHQGLFAKVDFANLGDETSVLADWNAGVESNVGPRRAVGLVAPGDEIASLNHSGDVTEIKGTSFAAPHVTATVALLQEFGDTVLRRSLQQQHQKSLNRPPWSLDARRHEVMKAVLLNAADKLRDSGSGFRLGMRRTILSKKNRTWLDSDAYRSPQIPLHAQMGTGQLNAYRAYQQFSAGQWSPPSTIPVLGWDYAAVALPEGTTSPRLETTAYKDYLFADPLQGGSFVAVTLAWNRRVELVDFNENGRFDLGEDFRDRGLNDLNLYLVSTEDNDSAQGVCSSVSRVDSVEHIFCQVPMTGRYKIRVQLRQAVHDSSQDYGLAWWAVPAP